tara:strand:+ start:330 stop:554 length:225 start_codon:yes stop_codon:yes gene_type:complete
MLSVRHKKIECIGCMVCVEAAPNYWHMDEDGMAQLNQVVSTRGHFEMADGFEEDLKVLKDAESECPVGIIQISG